MRRLASLALASVLGLLAWLLGALTFAALVGAAGAGNANLHLDKTVAKGTFHPSLDASLGVDRKTAIPGDTLTYQATLTNSGATVTLEGDLSAGNTQATTATVASYWDNVATSSNPGQGCSTDHGHDTSQWAPFVGTAASQSRYTPVVSPPTAKGMSLDLTPVPSSGVSYPSGADRILGTTLSPGATATWHYVATIPLSVADEGFLLDQKRVTKLRNTLHLEVTPRNAGSAQPAYVDTCFNRSLFGGGSPGTATDARIVITPPTGDPVTFSAPSTPGLASVAPGDSVKVTTPYKVPAVAVKGQDESDSDYLARLRAVDNSTLTAKATATATASDGSALTASPARADTTENLPILDITKTGPASGDPGSTLTYDLALKNSGGAPASSLDPTDQASDGTTGTVSDVPGGLDPGAAGTAKATVAVPPSEPAGKLTDTASLRWKDANGNDYGPISSAFDTTITAAAGVNPVATTAVQGNFYAADPSAQTFTAKPGDTPAFGQDFPTINFNPPAGTILHSLGGLPAVDPTTRPFTDITTDEHGNGNGALVAQGNGQQAGVGQLNSFDAALTANFVVAKAGDVTFNIVHDDGFLLGVGGGATRVSGAYENPPASGTTPFKQYPLVGAFDETTGSSPGTHPVTVHFPKAGTYPYELDYFESSGQQLSLTMTIASVAQTACGPLCLYVGYADGLRPAGSIFPFPWDGSPGVTFIGSGTFDSGALRFRNDSDSPIPLDSVVVDVGGAHFDIWPRNLTVPPHQDLILAQTNGENFDSSDFSGSGCGQNNGVKPTVTVVSGGKTTVFTDSNQVLNTGGFDLACQGNESISWQLVGGGGSAVNTPLPPASTLSLAPAAHTTLKVGQEQVFTASAMDSSGAPVANLPVNLALFGKNAQRLTATTDAKGVATFPAIVGHNAGDDSAQATAFVQGRLTVSNTTPLTWNIPVPGGPPSGGTPAEAPPSITDISPTTDTSHPAAVTAPAPVTAHIVPPSGQTITSWKVTYQGQSPGSPLVTLNSGSGTPPAPPDKLATFDPTLLPNDTYEITVSATTSGGGQQTATSTVAVSGNLKPGRYTTTYQDLNVPVNGFQMQVRRVYDSIDKRVGDFGVGWHVELANFGVSENRELGAGGWSQYGTTCFGALCLYAFKTSVPHYVTVTFPDGHQEVFDFTPQGGSTLFNTASPGFTARPGTGTTSTLETVGGGDLGLTAAGDLVDANGNPYNPTRFKLTTHDGTVLVLDTSTGLVSETDRNGNSLSVDSGGVHASNGESISFARDALGRITGITGPSGQHITYGYSQAGDLASSTDANGNATTYSYDPSHDLLKTMGPGGQALQTLTYDGAGRLSSVTDADGNKTAIDTNLAGRQQTVTDPNGKLTTIYTYDDLGDVLQRRELFGSNTLTTNYTYDAVGRPKSRTDPAGNTWAAAYNGDGDLTHFTLPSGHAVDITYDSFGNPVAETDPLGKTTTYAYDGNGNLSSVTDPLGHDETYAYDGAGRATAQTDRAGNKTTYAYDSAGNLSAQTDPLGNTTHYIHDGSGNLTSVTDPLGHTTGYAYNANGDLTSETDPLGHQTAYTYDALNRAVSKTDPLGRTTHWSYTGAGQLASTTDPAGGVTSYTYDADRNLTGTKDPRGGTTAFSYDGAGRLTGQTDPLGRVTSFAYDDAGNQTAVTDPAGNTTHMGYDSEGRLTGSTDPLSKTTSYSYDPAGDLTKTTDPLGNATTYAYDAAGRRVSETDPKGNTTAFAYDPTGRLTKLTDALGGTVKFSYDADGNHTGLTNPNDKTTSDAYDAAGQLTKETDPLGRSTTHTYDAAGQLASTTDGRGITTTYGYDGDGELTSLTAPGQSVSYGYDTLGRRASMTDGTGTTAYSYDPASDLTSVAAPAGTVSYTYDAAGQRQTMTLPGSRQVSYGYDSAANLTSTKDWLGKTISYGYDADGQQTSITRPNGVNTSVDYDEAGEVVSVKHDTSGGPIAHYSYTYDPNGNRTSITSAAGIENYTFDKLNRLTKAGYPNGDSASYTYDPAGNRTSSTLNGATTNATFDAANELTQNGPTAYTYDGAGNLLTAGSSSFSWDSLGRMSKATVGGQTTTYGYDGDGLRTGATSGPTTTPYLWDRQGGLPQLVDDGTTGYVQAGGVQEQIKRSSNATSFPLADALGSVRTLTDSTGAVTGTASYDAFGTPRSQSGAASIFGFTGEQTDPTGLVYLRSRYLDPSAGAFLSPDTVQPSTPGTQGYNSYSYVANNPTTATDPSGHQAFIEFAISQGRSVSQSTAARAVGFCLRGAFTGLLQDFAFQELLTRQYRFGSGSLANAALGCVGGARARGTHAPDDPVPPEPAAGGGGTAAEGEGALAGSIRNANPLGGTMNCVNCVIAGDAILSGAKASALDSVGPQAISILERQFGGTFERVTGEGEILRMLENAGSGARGIVYGERAGGVGHVFNAVNQRGAVRFLDPQIGGPASFEGYSGFRFLWTNVP